MVLFVLLNPVPPKQTKHHISLYLGWYSKGGTIKRDDGVVAFHLGVKRVPCKCLGMVRAALHCDFVVSENRVCCCYSL